jgi:hypothetical protein
MTTNRDSHLRERLIVVNLWVFNPCRTLPRGVFVAVAESRAVASDIRESSSIGHVRCSATSPKSGQGGPQRILLGMLL